MIMCKVVFATRTRDIGEIDEGDAGRRVRCVPLGCCCGSSDKDFCSERNSLSKLINQPPNPLKPDSR